MRVNCREQIANPAEPVNGQDERRKCAAVDSPARLCCSVIKRATAQDAAALCHYSERGIFHDRTRKVSRTYPAYTRCLLQDCYSPRCHRRSPEHTEPPQAGNRGYGQSWRVCPMSQLLPYETIVKASEGDPEAVAAVLSHYAGYVRSCAKMDGQINTDMQEHIVRQLIESLLKFRFDR